MPLSEHIYSSVSTGRQELSQCHYFKLQLGKLFGGKLECLGEKLPPSRLNSEIYMNEYQLCHGVKHLSPSIKSIPLKCCGMSDIYCIFGAGFNQIQVC